ncbi:CopD family protein [Beijerinckia indica]|uniref:Protoporphyrinogen IX oxidase n=1 Tax=Beijerinckia indica subsp. indica (strain ATCC 9039 / DSM 1715 / NCIMB 8712) TaxID=395963 RepID=B2IEB6_BEII9|nr:CopD family protein [Beijerinckia indica]ACB95514.1 conserved hypothetical protein [Beijerinckia indica subsp. indica ATCC 9039]
MDYYLWFKALHIAAVVTWIGGMLVMGMALSHLLASPQPSKPENVRLVEAIRLWDGRVTTPAMLLAWALGITMAVTARWFPAPWLMVKLVFVLALSALHGLEAGALRKWERDPEGSPPAFLRHAPRLIVAVVIAIAILAVVKPF